MADLVRLARGEIDIGAVRGITYSRPDGVILSTTIQGPRETDEMLPELDLAAQTLAKNGVIQLESSRGCSYACSFCPRQHKGIWSGDDPSAIDILMPDIHRIMKEFPDIDRRIFLVDEEFIGYSPNGQSENRVINVSQKLLQYGFRYETSARADQVYRPNKDNTWHIDRIKFWRQLIETGMDRCLFGIESGVDSILKRFNKKTSAEQNAHAIRILSLIGVPIRYTYITFDPLMSRREFFETLAFQKRTDLLLAPDPTLKADQILEIATDDRLAEQHSIGKEFFNAISYMMVSMECLKDAPYTAMARDQGLIGAFNPNMGRYECTYLDRNLQSISRLSQLWIDRNFSLDYLFKSIEKITTSEEKRSVGNLRRVLKSYAFYLIEDLAVGLDCSRSALSLSDTSIPDTDGYLTMDSYFSRLIGELHENFDRVRPKLSDKNQHLIASHLTDWSRRTDWGLINAA